MFEGEKDMATGDKFFALHDKWRDDLTDALVGFGCILLSDEHFVNKTQRMMVTKGHLGHKKCIDPHLGYPQVARVIYKLIIEGIKIHLLCASRLAQRAKIARIKIADLDPVPPPPPVDAIDIGAQGAGVAAQSLGNILLKISLQKPQWLFAMTERLSRG